MSTASIEMARAEAFGSFMKSMEKTHPGEVRLLSDSSFNTNIEVVSTGAISLDVALGCGGFPKGRIIEVYGPEMSGKTSLALSVGANCQRQGGTVAFVDAEHALNPQHAKDMGIDLARAVIYQPNSGEDAINMIEDMAKSGAFDIIIVDSVAALVPQAELDAEVEANQMALQARLMSKFMRRINGPVMQTNTMLILINQIRKDLGAYGAPDTTTGGRAIRFYSSVRIEVRSPASKKIEKNKIVIGQTCKAVVKKNKVGPPYREAEYDLYFGQGIQAGASLASVCEELGVIVRGGSSYTEVGTGLKVVGKENLRTMIDNDEEFRERLTAAVYVKLSQFGRTYVDDSDDDAAEFDEETDSGELRSGRQPPTNDGRGTTRKHDLTSYSVTTHRHRQGQVANAFYGTPLRIAWNASLARYHSNVPGRSQCGSPSYQYCLRFCLFCHRGTRGPQELYAE